MAWLAVLVAVVPAGCALLTYDERTRAHNEAMDSLAEQIRAALACRSDVAEVDVEYAYAWDMADAWVSVWLTSGADPGPVVDDATRRVWQSRLYPLKAITVSVGDSTDRARGEVRHMYPDPLGADTATMDRRYGPRPPRLRGWQWARYAADRAAAIAWTPATEPCPAA